MKPMKPKNYPQLIKDAQRAVDLLTVQNFDSGEMLIRELNAAKAKLEEIEAERVALINSHEYTNEFLS
jgi:acetolactate synthase small subunit